MLENVRHTCFVNDGGWRGENHVFDATLARCRVMRSVKTLVFTNTSKNLCWFHRVTPFVESEPIKTIFFVYIKFVISRADQEIYYCIVRYLLPLKGMPVMTWHSIVELLELYTSRSQFYFYSKFLFYEMMLLKVWFS